MIWGRGQIFQLFDRNVVQNVYEATAFKAGNGATETWSIWSLDWIQTGRESRSILPRYGSPDVYTPG